ALQFLDEPPAVLEARAQLVVRRAHVAGEVADHRPLDHVEVALHRLEHRRRLIEELQRTDAAISGLRATGAGVDDPQLAEDASLIDAEVELRDREGRVVGRWIVKDPKQVREGLGSGARPAPAADAPAVPPAAVPASDPAAGPEGK
ncbi:MAG: hypothetical protein ACKOHI_13050, partial [Phycisphaerales bacterium]